MSLFHRLFINSVFIYAAKIIEGILQLAVIAFIFSQVGKEYYAAALLIISVQATIELGRGGMQKATLKYIAEFRAKNEQTMVNSFLSSSAVMQGFIGLLGFCICVAVSPFSSTLFSLPEYMHQEAMRSTILLGIGIAISFFISPWHNSVAAIERYDLLSIATVLGKIVRASLIVALLLFDAPALISIVVATSFGIIVERLICIAFVKKICPDLKFIYKNVHMRYVKKMLSFSLFDFFHTLSGFLYMQGSLYLATHLISLNAVAALGAIRTIASLIGLVTHQIARMLIPVASRLNAEGNKEKLNNLVSKATKITVFTGGMVVAGIIPWLRSLLLIWLGPDYVELTIHAIIVITATFLVSSLTCIHNSLGGVGRVAVDGISSTICTILGLIIGIILVSCFELGLLGLVIGLLLARLFRFLFINFYGIKVFELETINFFWEGYLRTFLLILVVFFSGLWLDLSLNSWLTLITAGFFSSLIYFGIGIFWIIDSIDRSRFIKSIIDSKNMLYKALRL